MTVDAVPQEIRRNTRHAALDAGWHREPPLQNFAKFLQLPMTLASQSLACQRGGGGDINGHIPKTPLNHTRQHKQHYLSELCLSGHILVHFGG